MLDLVQKLQYKEQGFLFPLRVLAEPEAVEARQRFMDYLEVNRPRWEPLLPRERRAVFNDTHLLLPWVYRLAVHPPVLDAVESVLGPNLMVWSSQWFPKMPGDRSFVSWHQDATYWGLRPPTVATAWMALSESTRENGCLRVVPGSHARALLPQVETYAPDNMLSRGQEIAVEVEEAQAVDLILQPGEMSLHHIAIVHGSRPNTSGQPRIGIAIRYITPEVMQEGAERDLVLLVRGRDEFGNFEVVAPPLVEEGGREREVHAEALRRRVKNLMPKGYEPTKPR